MAVPWTDEERPADLDLAAPPDAQEVTVTTWSPRAHTPRYAAGLAAVSLAAGLSVGPSPMTARAGAPAPGLAPEASEATPTRVDRLVVVEPDRGSGVSPAATLTFNVHVDARGERAGLFVVVASRRDPVAGRTGFLYSDVSSAWSPTVHGGGSSSCPADRCVVTPLDEDSVTVRLGSDQQRGARDWWFVGAYGDLTVHVRSAGWRARDLRPSLMRMVQVPAVGEGAGVGPFLAEHSTPAVLPGGRRGSHALAIAPCSVVGVGSLTLRGAASPVELGCPSSWLVGTRWIAPAHAAGATTWDLRGDVVGLSDVRLRLGVLSLPRRSIPVLRAGEVTRPG